MPQEQQKQILEFLTKTVKEAYLQIKDIEKEISKKGIKDYVTNCDLLVEKYIIKQINANYPNIEILSEEFNCDKEKTKKYFVIDPIDGTKNFISGLNIWGIQVAYVENDETLVSCLYYPELDSIIKSVKDIGTFVNDEKVKVKEYKGLENSLISIDTKYNSKKYKFCEEINKTISGVRNFGAPCFGFGMVAQGSIDGYCILQNTPWDIEPGLLACKEAGAKVYRDDFCTIVANSEEIIKVVLDSLDVAFGEEKKYI